MDRQYHANRNCQVHLSKIKGDVCDCDYMWLRATTKGGVKRVTEFKGVQLSDESIHAEPHHYKVKSGQFKAPAASHRKRNPCYVLNRRLVDLSAGLEVLDEKISFFRREALFASSVVRPVT
jgi:hypothetical protein